MTEFSVAQQIEEVEYELKKRSEVYPNQVRRGNMRQSVADYHTARMTAVLDTLRKLQLNGEVRLVD